MDEKFIERPKKFDRNAYNKANFAQFNLRIKPELKTEIDDYCKDNNTSKSEFCDLLLKR